LTQGAWKRKAEAAFGENSRPGSGRKASPLGHGRRVQSEWLNRWRPNLRAAHPKTHGPARREGLIRGLERGKAVAADAKKTCPRNRGGEEGLGRFFCLEKEKKRREKGSHRFRSGFWATSGTGVILSADFLSKAAAVRAWCPCPKRAAWQNGQTGCIGGQGVAGSRRAHRHGRWSRVGRQPSAERCLPPTKTGSRVYAHGRLFPADWVPLEGSNPGGGCCLAAWQGLLWELDALEFSVFNDFLCGPAPTQIRPLPDDPRGRGGDHPRAEFSSVVMRGAFTGLRLKRARNPAAEHGGLGGCGPGGGPRRAARAGVGRQLTAQMEGRCP